MSLEIGKLYLGGLQEAVTPLCFFTHGHWLNPVVDLSGNLAEFVRFYTRPAKRLTLRLA